MAEPADNPAERLAEQLGDSVRASAVFGEPVEREGVTVIPVARARFAFGGGGGSDGTGQGSGGGGAGTVRPIGYIEVRESGVTYTPIRDWREVSLAAAGVFTAVGLVTAAMIRRR